MIGWAMATHLRTELVLVALDMALEQRRPHGVIHHSDHGCQYTAIAQPITRRLQASRTTERERKPAPVGT